ncbi:MAG: GIY-YIG nuclease family protein, partial [Gammaproteobacteria bacterium]|nr:GIY-YIG nuclease family protein [Gammaproteobacteria bacterium]
MSKFTFAQSSLTHVPSLPGVYIYIDSDNRPIYVGKAKNLKKRVSTYFSKPPKYHKVQLIQEKSSFFEVIVTSTEHEAFLLENKLIKKHQPILNILLKDDKSFPYVSLSQHAFPRLFMTRKVDTKNKSYGPYSNVGAVKDTIDHLQRAFKIRTCRDYFFKQRTRPCLQYQINR